VGILQKFEIKFQILECSGNFDLKNKFMKVFLKEKEGNSDLKKKFKKVLERKGREF
jgi:hypothetical protein